MARFTAANAREMAARSVAVRKAAEAQRCAERESTAQVSLLQRPDDGEDDFLARRLFNLSAQIEKVHSMIDHEQDASRLARLVRVPVMLYKMDTRLRYPASARQSRLSRAFMREHSRPMVSGFDDDPPEQGEEAGQREQSRPDVGGFEDAPPT